MIIVVVINRQDVLSNYYLPDQIGRTSSVLFHWTFTFNKGALKNQNDESTDEKMEAEKAWVA